MNTWGPLLKQLRAFVSCKPFQPSPMFVSMAIATHIRLGWKGNLCNIFAMCVMKKKRL